jgi:RNA polymerase sigma-70 factor (ECF subfamily)
MNAEPLDILLQELRSGDVAAIERVFVTYETYLRVIVRRHIPRKLQAKFDSADVVQSVWAGLAPGFRDGRWTFDTTAQLRAFLVKVTRRRLSDRLRRHRLDLEKEQPSEPGKPAVEPAAPQPRPSQTAQAADLWEKMLALCPPNYHELLRLKLQGLPLAEIATRTGLHEGSVRRILRKLASQLALDQDSSDAPLS